MIKKFLKRSFTKKGTSMSDIIVWIVIAASVAAGAFGIYSYFTSQDATTKIKQAVNTIAVNIRKVYAGQDYTGVDTEQVVKLEMIPSNLARSSGTSIVHSLGGNITVDGSAGDSFTITVDKLPLSVCEELAMFNTDSWVTVTGNCTDDSSANNNNVVFESY